MLDLMRDIILATDLAHHLRIFKDLQKMAEGACLLPRTLGLGRDPQEWDLPGEHPQKFRPTPSSINPQGRPSPGPLVPMQNAKFRGPLGVGPGGIVLRERGQEAGPHFLTPSSPQQWAMIQPISSTTASSFASL